MNETRGLWRGKRINNKEHNGEWVEGILYPVKYTGFNIPGGIDYYIITYPSGGGEQQIQVDPSTLGECTGLRDKNGKLIFEGDIIKTKKYGKIVEHSNVSDYDIFVVKYEPAMFRLINHNRGFNLVDDGDSKFEVIGNIHGTPELLKGADNVSQES